MAEDKARSKCFTFYSYKGGSGRTTTMLNTVKHLIDEMGASESNPILLVDADLESAGLTYFFGCADKFIDAFNDSIHTCKLFNLAGTVLQRGEKSAIFGNQQGSISKSFKAYIPELAELYGESRPDQTLANISLSPTAMGIFGGIANACCSYIKLAEGAGSFNVEIGKRYLNSFNRLLKGLWEIESDQGKSDEQKKAEKIEKIEEFLPARSFLDVSKHFGAPLGTVKFLGVDVNYRGEQIAANDSLKAINALIRACSENGYKAVVFDSGAGEQSSASILHKTSDVIVCCLRPSRQFISGTRLQLSRHKENLLDKKKKKSDQSKKMVVLLPTAVPQSNQDFGGVEAESFEDIAEIAKSYADVVDGAFCNQDACVHEVSLFKWREQILGVTDPRDLSPAVRAVSDRYAAFDGMPEDAKSAYKAYGELAKALIKNG